MPVCIATESQRLCGGAGARPVAFGREFADLTRSGLMRQVRERTVAVSMMQ